MARGLAVLQKLSTVDGLSINELARRLGLARPTAYRIIKTLEEESFVRYSETDGRYRLTSMVGTIAPVDKGDAWIADICLPELQAFTRTHLWPLSFSTLYGIQMMTRARTDHESPYALRHYRQGYLANVIGSSNGLCYLAFCHSGLREKLIDDIRQAVETGGLSDRYRYMLINIDDQMRTIRRDGCVFAPFPFDGESAISLPLIDGGDLLGSISMRFIVSAKTRADIKVEFLPILTALCRTIVDKRAVYQRDIMTAQAPG